MTQNCILKPVGRCLAVGLVISGCLNGLAAEKTNAVSKTQDPCEPALGRIGKAAKWKDPGQVLPEVVWEEVYVKTAATNLLDRFKQKFDVLLPTDLPPNSFDWLETPVTLRLKNVTASEVFNAMNLYFEINQQPLRWELLTNGRRPTALLHISLPPASPEPAEATGRAVLYVGELVGDKQSGGMAIEAIREIVNRIFLREFHSTKDVYFDAAAELFVVSGPAEEIALVRDTINALKEKMRADHQKKMQTAALPGAGPFPR